MVKCLSGPSLQNGYPACLFAMARAHMWRWKGRATIHSVTDKIAIADIGLLEGRWRHLPMVASPINRWEAHGRRKGRDGRLLTSASILRLQPPRLLLHRNMEHLLLPVPCCRCGGALAKGQRLTGGPSPDEGCISFGWCKQPYENTFAKTDVVSLARARFSWGLWAAVVQYMHDRNVRIYK